MTSPLRQTSGSGEALKTIDKRSLIMVEYVSVHECLHGTFIEVWLSTISYVYYRGVAQFGRALRSGRRGRVFESRHLDCKKGHQKDVLVCS